LSSSLSLSLAVVGFVDRLVRSVSISIFGRCQNVIVLLLTRECARSRFDTSPTQTFSETHVLCTNCAFTYVTMISIMLVVT
jgi:hypothetical protein